MFCILKAAEVALHLSSVHRWCVTGTPIQKGLEGNVGWLLLSCIASVPMLVKSSSRLIMWKLWQEYKIEEEYAGSGVGE